MMTSILTPGWLSANDFISIGRDDQHELDVKATADRLQILNVLNRYAWSYDEREIASLGDTFSEDAVFEGNVRSEFVIEPIRGRAAIVEWLQGHMNSQTDQRRHNVINVIFTEQSAFDARVLSTLLLTSATDEGVRFVTTGTYDTHFIKDDAGIWRIGHFFAGFDFPF